MKRSKYTLFYILFIVSLLFQSCNSYRELLYFQNLDNTRPVKENIQNFSAMTIQKEDILGINVSSLNPEASALFNPNLPANGNPSDPLSGYHVDQKGMIEMPVIGDIKAEGLNTADLREQIKKKLEPYLKEPVVNVRILNFKVSVLGDVGRPGVYPVQSERITLTEAISLAGDLLVTANRNDMWLIREHDGTREYIPVDLTSKNIFSSPYYYLKNNDLIYIQPGKAKYSSVDNTPRNIGLLLSVLSIVAIMMTNY